ncbi:hypothetical protein CS542_09585 [Pedobacter sp. IW39]|nr:hypothetical protein CS542_09585 [Pedobacter sp. IW39]
MKPSGNETLALVKEELRGKQTIKLSRYNPTKGTIETLYELNETDNYNNPGSPVTEKCFWPSGCTDCDNGAKLLMNNITGSSPKGDLPFLAKFDLASKRTRLSGVVQKVLRICCRCIGC